MWNIMRLFTETFNNNSDRFIMIPFDIPFRWNCYYALYDRYHNKFYVSRDDVCDLCKKVCERDMKTQEHEIYAYFVSNSTNNTKGRKIKAVLFKDYLRYKFIKQVYVYDEIVESVSANLWRIHTRFLFAIDFYGTTKIMAIENLANQMYLDDNDQIQNIDQIKDRVNQKITDEFKTFILDELFDCSD